MHNYLEIFIPKGFPVQKYDMGSFFGSIWKSAEFLWDAICHADSQNEIQIQALLNASTEFLSKVYNHYPSNYCVPIIACLMMGVSEDKIEEHIYNSRNI